jgi:hypothetical protein
LPVPVPVGWRFLLGLLLRCRRVTPLIVAHARFDLAVSTNTSLPRSGALVVLVLLSTAFVALAPAGYDSRCTRPRSLEARRGN